MYSFSRANNLYSRQCYISVYKSIYQEVFFFFLSEFTRLYRKTYWQTRQLVYVFLEELRCTFLLSFYTICCTPYYAKLIEIFLKMESLSGEPHREKVFFFRLLSFRELIYLKQVDWIKKNNLTQMKQS